MRHVVMYSGGIGSWGTAEVVRNRAYEWDITLLFADTLNEDADLYRFLKEEGACAADRSGPGCSAAS